MRIGRKWQKVVYWKAWIEIIQYHSFSVKDAELRLKILFHNFDRWMKNNHQHSSTKWKKWPWILIQIQIRIKIGPKMQPIRPWTKCRQFRENLSIAFSVKVLADKRTKVTINITFFGGDKLHNNNNRLLLNYNKQKSKHYVPRRRYLHSHSNRLLLSYCM